MLFVILAHCLKFLSLYCIFGNVDTTFCHTDPVPPVSYLSIPYKILSSKQKNCATFRKKVMCFWIKDYEQNEIDYLHVWTFLDTDSLFAEQKPIWNNNQTLTARITFYFLRIRIKWSQLFPWSVYFCVWSEKMCPYLFIARLWQFCCGITVF